MWKLKFANKYSCLVCVLIVASRAVGEQSKITEWEMQSEHFVENYDYSWTEDGSSLLPQNLDDEPFVIEEVHHPRDQQADAFKEVTSSKVEGASSQRRYSGRYDRLITSCGNGLRYEFMKEIMKPNSFTGSDGMCSSAKKTFSELSIYLKSITMEHGIPGNKGKRGPQGLPGVIHALGRIGDKGDGLSGPAGPPGPQGDRGRQGVKGVKGEIGLKGPTGDRGSFTQGFPGLKGDRGDSILSYSEGPPGLKGTAGFGFLTFSKFVELKQREKESKPGSIAFVAETGKFYGRIPTGWATLLLFQLPVDGSMPPKIRRKQHLERANTTKVTKSPKPDATLELDKKPTPPLKFSSTKQFGAEASSLRLVALNEPWSGNMRGIDLINYQCQKEAMNAGIDGIFRAFLSTSGSNLKSLVRHPNSTVVNLHNGTLYATWRDVFKLGKRFVEQKTALLDSLVGNSSAVLSSFEGKDVIFDESQWKVNVIWHGAFLSGRGSSRNCNNWTSASSQSFGIASDFLFMYLLDRQNMQCDEKLIVLCIEVPLVDFKEYRTLHPIGEGDASGYIQFDEHKRFLQFYDSLPDL